MVSEQVLIDEFERISRFEVEQATELINQFEEEQPDICEFIIDNSENYSEMEAEIQMFGALVIWQSLKADKGKIPEVGYESIEECVKANVAMFEQLDEESAGDAYVFVEKMVASYPQPNLLMYIIEMLLTVDDDEEVDVENFSAISEEAKVNILLTLKSIVDCLDEA
jgi:hypothetical protein